MDKLEQQWQARIDTDFPNGLLATWDRPDNAVVYQVPYVAVVGSAGLDPLVDFGVFGVDKRFRLRLLSYDVLQTVPCLNVRVAFDNVETPMFWSGGLGPKLAARMRAGRDANAEYYAGRRAEGLDL